MTTARVQQYIQIDTMAEQAMLNHLYIYRLSVELGQHRGEEGLGHVSSATALPFVGCPRLAVLQSSGGAMYGMKVADGGCRAAPGGQGSRAECVQQQCSSVAIAFVGATWWFTAQHLEPTTHTTG